MKLMNPKAIILLLATLTFSMAAKLVIYDPYNANSNGQVCKHLTGGASKSDTDIKNVYTCESKKYYPCKEYVKDQIPYNIIQVLKHGEGFVGASPHELITLGEIYIDVTSETYVLKCVQELETKINEKISFIKKLK
jgi:hypothetical protein